MTEDTKYFLFFNNNNNNNNNNNKEKALRIFPLGSSGGPDGITPQHLRDLLCRATEDDLRTSLTDLVNILLAGDLTTASLAGG